MVMTNILHKQVIRPRDAPQGAILLEASPTARSTSTVMDQTDVQLIHVIDTVVDFDADVMTLHHDLITGTIVGEEHFGLLKSLRTMDALHVAAAITVANAANEPEDLNFPNFDSGCSAVLTNSMLNCSAVEAHVATIMQAEHGAKMLSTHKCKKTYYVASRCGNIVALEFDALIVPQLKQDLIGGRAVTNGMDFQVILDKDPNICGIYPRIDDKLCSIEDSIPFISDDLRLFQLRTLSLSRESFVKRTGMDLWHQRFAHISNESIFNSMGYTVGMKNIPKRIPRGVNCPNCMIGKCQRRDLPPARKYGTSAPLEQVNWDLMMVN